MVEFLILRKRIRLKLYMIVWNKLEKSGDLDKHYKSLRDKATNYVERPEVVKNINNTKSGRTWDFDPTYRVHKNILDHKGNILHMAGTC